MKKSLLLIASSLLLLGSCGGESSPVATTPSDVPSSGTKTSTKTDSKTATSSKTGSKSDSKTSSSSTPKPHTEHTWAKTGEGTDYQIDGCSGCELVSYSKPVSSNIEGTAYNENGGTVLKLSKGASVSWKFTLPEGKKVDLYIGAQCSYDDHLDRYLFNMNKSVHPTNPITGEPFDDDTHQNPDQATEDPWRYAIAINGVDSPLKNGKTMRENGMEAGTSGSLAKDLYLTSFDMPAGENVITLTQKNIGFRTLFSGNVRLVITGDYVAPEPVKTYELKTASIAVENEKAIVTYHGEYENYTFAEIQALDWQGGFQGNMNAGGSNWDWVDYGEGKANALAISEEGTGKFAIKLDVTDLPVNHYTGKLGVGVNPETADNNKGKAKDVHVTGENAEITIGDKVYTFQPDGGEANWNLPALNIVDNGVASTTIESGALAVEEGKAVFSYTVKYTKYTAAEVVALDWQGAWQLHGGSWPWIEYGSNKDNALSFDTTTAGTLIIKMDVTALTPSDPWMGKMGIGVQASGDNAGRAYDVHIAGQAAEITVGIKTYSFNPADDGSWGLPTITVSSAVTADQVVTSAAEIVEVESKAIFRISGTYTCTDEQIALIDRYFDFESNGNFINDTWNCYVRFKLPMVLTAENGQWQIDIDVSELENFAYTTHFGWFASASTDLKLATALDSSVVIGGRTYRIMNVPGSSNPKEFWGTVGLVVTETGVAKTWEIAGLPDWIANDGAKLYAWVWGPDEGSGQWAPLTFDAEDATKATFSANNTIVGFKLARMAGDAEPSFDTAWNKTDNFYRCPGISSYEAASWAN